MPSCNVLVTGGAGFIGSNLSEALLKKGHRVLIIDDLSGGYRENIPNGAEFEQISVTDRDAINRLFQQHPFEYVFHLAAYAAEGLSHFIRNFNYQNNVVGSINLINASVISQRVKCFVFTSSIAVYGTNQLPMSEDLTPQPEDPYGIAKYAVELDLKAAYHMFGLPYIIFRPHNVYGERQNIADPYRNVVGIFMNQCLRGLPMTIFGSGEQTRAFSYIKDVVEIMAQSVETPSAYQQTFNIGCDLPVNVNNLAKLVAQVLGVQENVKHLPERKEVLHAYADHSKLKTIFKSSRQTPLEEGLKLMAKWVKKHGACEPTGFQQPEVLLNLPPSWKR
jgi:UDP-glucose 4-epimerase